MKFKFLKGITVLIASTLHGCTTTGPSYKAAEVIERIGGKGETPAWATGEVPMYEKEGKVFFTSTTNMSGDSRPDACMKVAGETGRVEIMRHIKDNVTASGQVSEQSATSDPGVESLMAFLSQGKLSGVSIAERYWEKRLESDSSGTRVLKIHCAAKVSISRADLTRQLQEALGNGGNPEIRKKLLEAQKSFIDGLSAGNPAN